MVHLPMEVATTTALADFSAVYRCQQIGLISTAIRDAAFLCGGDGGVVAVVYVTELDHSVD